MCIFLQLDNMQVTKLGKMLALFMREDEGKSIESL